MYKLTLFAIIIFSSLTVFAQDDKDTVEMKQAALVQQARDSGLFQKPGFKLESFNKMLEQIAEDGKKAPPKIDVPPTQANMAMENTAPAVSNTASELPMWALALIVVGSLAVIGIFVIVVQLVMLVRN